MKKNFKKGFTLVELMIVMAIIAVLATLMIGAVQLARRTATETTHRANAKSIQTALEGQFARHRQYCGLTGQPACATYSFGALAGDSAQRGSIAVPPNNLGINIGSAHNDCNLVTSARGGGGTVTIANSTYTITPFDERCANPMTADVLSM